MDKFEIGILFIETIKEDPRNHVNQMIRLVIIYFGYAIIFRKVKMGAVVDVVEAVM